MNSLDLPARARARADTLLAYASSIRTLEACAHASWGELSSAVISPVGGDAIAEPANRMAVLPMPLAERVLRVRALLHRSPQLRLNLAPSIRRLGFEWVGATAWRALLADGPSPRAVLGVPVGDAATTAHALAWEGFCRMDGDRAWGEPSLVRMIRLRFCRDASQIEVEPEPALTDWVLARMPEFVPEAPWLSG